MMAVTGNFGSRSYRENRYIGMVIITAALILPVLNPTGTGWLSGLIPLPVFYYLICLGQKEGTTIVRNAIILSSIAAMVFGSLPLLIFSLSFVPPGFVLFQAARSDTPPDRTILRGAVVLGAAWLIFWGISGVITQANPYTALLAALDESLGSLATFYRESTELPAETLRHLDLALEELRRVIPKILPAMLISGLIFTIWMNVALGNWLLKRKSPDLAPWQDFKEWRLPEHLVWGVIAGGVLLLAFSGRAEIIGLNMLLVCGSLYFLQGLAVLVAMLNRWNAPVPVRFIIYGLIIVQSYGIIFLSVLGLIDVWADFRNNSQNEPPDNENDAAP